MQIVGYVDVGVGGATWLYTRCGMEGLMLLNLDVALGRNRRYWRTRGEEEQEKMEEDERWRAARDIVVSA